MEITADLQCQKLKGQKGAKMSKSNLNDGVGMLLYILGLGLESKKVIPGTCLYIPGSMR